MRLRGWVIDVCVCECVCAVPVVHGADVLVVQGHRISVRLEKKRRICGERTEQDMKHTGHSDTIRT